MHFLVYLPVFIPLIGALVPVQNIEDALIPFIVHEIEDLKSLVGDLKSKLESAKKKDNDFVEGLTTAEKNIKQLTDRRDVQRRAFSEAQVAFYAKLSASLHGLSPHQTIIFDALVTTTQTSLYDTTTGIFTAPVSGMYVISWTANVDHQESQATELMINGRSKAWSFADTAGSEDRDYGSASQTVVLQVNKGENVWVRTGTNGKGDVSGNDYSTFSAFLLFPHSL
ncbi:complement C1q-like protein 2 [Mytilus californianus]|uniref:complement C1q-like protein 2 n=1 Tax=Mytilus californianus TaxID=6549 RepID=UPI002246F0F6|nr:complement C1q-like protein 2 [Mytilus californianus]